MLATITSISEKKIIGMRKKMSYAQYTIADLWRSFSPRKKEIMHQVGSDVISLVNYAPNHFVDFKPSNEFERWAAVEVSSLEHIPNEMESFTIEAGQYAVFHYQGMSNDPTIFQYIYGTWLPSSGFALDSRPHFEVLGSKYKNNDPLSEEEIWIPIKAK